MSDIDGTAITALIVSVVALLVALLQVIQQYASTAYDYRRCSSRVVGSWGRRTHPRFIFHEVRFEITFSTPHITLSIEPLESDEDTSSGNPNPTAEFGDFGSEKPTVPPQKTAVPEGDVYLSMDRPKQYLFEADERYKDDLKTPRNSNVEDKPWFLNIDDHTVPEAKSSWLTLLNDTQYTNLYCRIKERRGSYDYMPPGITRPMASMDKLSFLTMMSLRQINWHNRGDGEVLKGVGHRCELRCTDVPGFGPVYTYELRHTGSGKFPTRLSSNHPNRRLRYMIGSKAAQRAMFNEFDIGFGKIHTHSEQEIAQSLKTVFVGMDVQLVDGIAEVMEQEGWCPGLGETIACWNVERSMPKVVRADDKFLSVFSSHSLTSLLGVPMVVRMLCGPTELPPARLKFQAVRVVSGWANELHQKLAELECDVKTPLLEALKTARIPRANNLTDNDLSWSCSLRCLEAVKTLDDLFEEDLTRYFPGGDDDSESDSHSEKYRNRRTFIARKFARRQARHGFRVYSEAMGLGSRQVHSSGSLDRWMARVTVDIVEEVTAELGRGNEDVDAKTVQMMMMNRLVRGALWIAHNGNAPGMETGRRDRLWECSLSHKWLMDRSTVYIA